MMNENLARVLIAEKYEQLRHYKCTKSVCIDTEGRRKRQ